MAAEIDDLGMEPGLAHAGADTHFLQLYEADDVALVRNAAAFLAAGLRHGSTAVVVASDEHTPAIVQHLEGAGFEAAALERSGRLQVFDAAETLGRFVVDGHPDAVRFDRIVGDAVRRSMALAGGNGVRAYGEMVGLLWKDRQYPAAIRLEQLWHKLRAQAPFSLFCWYPIDIFAPDFDSGIVDALLSAHTHLLPRDAHGHLYAALERAMDEVLGADDPSRGVRVRAHRGRHPYWGQLPAAESTILWLRRAVPDRADRVLALAREYYTARLAI